MTYRCPCHICSEHTWDNAKVEYSPTVRGWYILLDKTRESDIVRTHGDEVTVNFDYGVDGQIVGIEIL